MFIVVCVGVWCSEGESTATNAGLITVLTSGSLTLQCLELGDRYRHTHVIRGRLVLSPYQISKVNKYYAKTYMQLCFCFSFLFQFHNARNYNGNRLYDEYNLKKILRGIKRFFNIVK